MKLIVQPDAGIAPIVTAIKQARKSIDILIFRLDRFEIAQALAAAVARGVRVRALTAHTNRGGTKSLRKLEMSLLEAGVTVSRTADDLVRYHGKMMIVDNKFLHVYGFNFTGLDIAKSRSFGVVSKNGKLVHEANKLFMADFDRLPYTSGYERFVVSPDNARDRLARFISGARKQLLIYDPQATDDAMLRLITERIKAGVDVRIIGRVEAKWKHQAARSIRASGCTSARSSATAAARSSAARACAGSSSRNAARSASSSPTRRSSGRCRRCSRRTGRETPSGKKKRKKEEKAGKKELKLAKAS